MYNDDIRKTKATTQAVNRSMGAANTGYAVKPKLEQRPSFSMNHRMGSHQSQNKKF